MLKRISQLSACLMIIFALNPVNANPDLKELAEFDRCKEICPGEPVKKRTECCNMCGQKHLQDPNAREEQIQNCIINHHQE